MLPMLADSISGFDEPSAVFGDFQQVSRRKILGAVLGRIAKRFKQPRIDQCGDVMHLAVQHPTRLFRREADGQLTEQREKP